MELEYQRLILKTNGELRDANNRLRKENGSLRAECRRLKRELREARLASASAERITEAADGVPVGSAWVALPWYGYVS